jgi:hypothetical protein
MAGLSARKLSASLFCLEASMQTLLEALQQLKEMGYKEDFNAKLSKIISGTDHEKKLHRLHDEFVVDKVFRIDEDSDGGGQSVAYGVSSKVDGSKGVIVSGYGIYTDSTTNEILDEIEIPKGKERPPNPEELSPAKH